MTPQEKELIQHVFERLARAGQAPKDAEADAWIRDCLAHLPDAPYGLVQAVILLEGQLNQAGAHIADLTRQLEQARSSGPVSGGQASGGSFLGGAGPWGGGSVPRSGGPQPQPQFQPQPAPGWGQAAPQPQQAPWAQPSAGNSFLRNAATMAAGVAGGSLLADGIASLFGGRHMWGGGMGGFAGGNPWGSSGPVEENVTVNNYYDGQGGTDDGGGQGQDYQDASFDDSGSYDDGGFDSGSDV